MHTSPRAQPIPPSAPPFPHSPIPLIQSPHGDIIGILIRNDHIPPVRREREVPGPLTAAGVPGGFPKPAGKRIDGEYCYAVVPAVG